MFDRIHLRSHLLLGHLFVVQDFIDDISMFLGISINKMLVTTAHYFIEIRIDSIWTMEMPRNKRNSLIVFPSILDGNGDIMILGFCHLLWQIISCGLIEINAIHRIFP